MAEIQAQIAMGRFIFGKECFARHKCDTRRQCRLQQGTSIPHLLELQPEEQATRRHLPLRQIRELALQRGGKRVTSLAVERL